MKRILLLVVVLLALFILVENTSVVTIRFLFWKAEMSQVVLILLVLAVGYVAGFLTARILASRRSRMRR